MIKIVEVLAEGHELELIRGLFAKYEKELDADLQFQRFKEELENPLKKYGKPAGVLLLAYWNNEVAGCIALAPLKEPDVCEMKRLYVRPEYRAHGVGRVLAEELLMYAARGGYKKMRLDTFRKLTSAIRLYEKLGFYYTEPYYFNPYPETVFMEKKLGQ